MTRVRDAIRTSSEASVEDNVLRPNLLDSASVHQRAFASIAAYDVRAGFMLLDRRGAGPRRPDSGPTSGFFRTLGVVLNGMRVPVERGGASRSRRR